MPNQISRNKYFMYRILLTLQQTSAKHPEIFPFFYEIPSFNLKDLTSGIAKCASLCPFGLFFANNTSSMSRFKIVI